jgi:gamma-glutamyltranspeptidase/glutathione hydrolase
MADMKRYRPIWEKPLSTSFRGNLVYAPGKSNAQGIQILEALNLAEELKLDQKEPYWKDWKSFRSLSQILQCVQLGVYAPEALKAANLRGASLSPEDLATKAFARAVAPMIGEVSSPTQKPEPLNHSDSVVVIDRWGNVAVLVHSINTILWGTTGIVVGGIPIADALGFKQAQLAALKPGDRLPNDAAPVIAMTGSTPTLAVATIGSSLAPETVRMLIGVLGNRLSPQTVMEAPPLLLNFDPQKSGQIFVPEGAYEASFVNSLRSAGAKVESNSAFQTLAVRGTAVVGIIDRKSGIRHSVETPQVFGFASAY